MEALLARLLDPVLLVPSLVFGALTPLVVASVRRRDCRSRCPGNEPFCNSGNPRFQPGVVRSGGLSRRTLGGDGLLN